MAARKKTAAKKSGGSGIHIKPGNEGKFTASAKKAGKSVQQHARSVMANPRASSTQRSRANFACLAKHHFQKGVCKSAPKKTKSKSRKS